MEEICHRTSPMSHHVACCVNGHAANACYSLKGTFFVCFFFAMMENNNLSARGLYVETNIVFVHVNYYVQTSKN